MKITYEELRSIKHRLPTGSVRKIADKLNIDEQTVRNYFGAQKYENGQIVDFHREKGPHGMIVYIEDETILNLAKELISQSN